ncbi:MAG TPA: TonB-dependent receptor [Gammaproteobacteria bacterium]|nr:TonB-dependent receptor [Gammaproteobacteria bacterium]
MRRNIYLRKKQLAIAISTALPIMTATVGGKAQAQQQQTVEETVVVTGSRIVRRDLTAASPIITVGTESFDNSATTAVESVLNQLPQFVPDDTQFTSSIQNSATNTPGAATLNLRGLGNNRNLVLVDGKRAQPANATLVVDINTIPAAAIANVEIITGGASAVYGPDAMAGVVNFILKDNFEGLDLDLQAGTTDHGGGNENRFSALMGMNSADGRGNIMIGIERTSRAPVLQRERDFYLNGWFDPGNAGGGFIAPAAFAGNANPNPASAAAINALFPQGPGTLGRSTDIYFNEDGTPFVVQGGGLGYNGPLGCLDGCGDYTMIQVLDNGNLDQRIAAPYSLLSSPMERNSVFARGTYEIAPSISVFTQVNYSTIEVGQRGGVPPAITVWQAPGVPRDGRPLPPDLEDLLDSRDDPDAPWPLFHVLDYNGPILATNHNDVWQFMVGLEGNLRDDWTWEAYASRGDTYIEAVHNRLPSLQRYQELVYAPNFGQVTNYTPGTVNGVGTGRGYLLTCTSGLPVFEKFDVSQDCLDSIDTGMINRNHLTQDIFEFNLQGSWLEMPAGQLQFAVGTHYRENSYQFTPGNPIPQLRDNPIGIFANNATGGAIDVTEFYGELLVPVLENLDFELGYRYSDFSTAGGQDTNKALFTWRATDALTLRGGMQQANRAPNIAELFTAPTQEVVGHPQQDPCSVTTLSPWGNVGTFIPGRSSQLPLNPDRQQVIDLCRDIIGNDTSGFDTQTYSITGVDGPEGFHRQNPPFFPLEIALRQGNPNVNPEEGTTYTIGAVVESPFGADGLTLTVDYYDIEVTEAIFPLLVSTVYDNCMNFNGVSNPTYDINNSWCQMIRRNPFTGDREEVDTPFFNLGTLTTNGLDVTVNYLRDVGPGTLSLNSNLSFLDSFEYQTAPGGTVIDATGTLDQGGMFEFQHLTRLDYIWGDVRLGLSWRHLGSAESAGAAQSPNTSVLGPDSYNIFNFRGGFAIADNYDLRFGIDNLFDTDPELTASNPAGGDTNTDVTMPSLYDVLGRRYYVGLRVSF